MNSTRTYSWFKLSCVIFLKYLIYTLLIIWSCTSVAHAQIVGHTEFNRGLKELSSHLKRATFYYQEYAYKKAAKHYTKSLRKQDDDSIRLLIAECYRKLSDNKSALKWYSEAIENTKVVRSIHQLYYAEALSRDGQYLEAVKWYEAYKESIDDDQRPDRKVNAIAAIDSLYADSATYQIKQLAINSGDADLAPTFYQEGIVFTSDRDVNQPLSNVSTRNSGRYLSLYYARFREDGSMADPRDFPGWARGKYHEGPAAYYANDTKMILTRNSLSEANKSQEAVVRLKLFQSEKDRDGVWSQAIELPFNDDGFSTGHATIDPEGSTLFFVSDRPGGLGGTDIYVSYFDGDSWSDPKNLGSTINTEGNEMFPFLLDQVLYFSSDGYGSLGGFDIYASTRGNQWGKPKNLGYPINSQGDDFGFIMDKNDKYGFLSSDRDNNSGDDIYLFWFK